MDKFIGGIIISGFILLFILLEKLRRSEWWKHRGNRETLGYGSGTAKIDAVLLLRNSETKSDIVALLHSLRDPATQSTTISVLKKMSPTALETFRNFLASEKNEEIKAILIDIIKELEKKKHP